MGLLLDGVTEERARALLAALPPPLAGRLKVASTRAVPAGACRVVAENALAPRLACPRVVSTAAAANASLRKWVVVSSRAFASHGTVSAPPAQSSVFVSFPPDMAPAAAARHLAHELGHALGLRDEEAVLAIAAGDPGRTPGPNCARDRAEARRRWGDLVARGEAHEAAGCAGHRDYLKPSPEGIMAERGDAFGAAQSRYLDRALLCCYGSAADCVTWARQDPELARCARRSEAAQAR